MVIVDNDRPDHAQTLTSATLPNGLPADLPTDPKARAEVLAAVVERGKILLVLDRTEAHTWKSLRNAAAAHLIYADQLNTYDVLVSDEVVFTTAALDTFVSGPPAGRSATASATSTEAAALETEETV